MPELPEVETTVRGLRKKVLNRTFLNAWTDIKRFKGLKKIKGKKIKDIKRRGKNIIFCLSDNSFLLIHQKMTGHLLVGRWKMKEGKWQASKGPLSEKINTFLHLVFTFDNGLMMALSDVRKFAKAKIIKDIDKELSLLGPEPLEKNFTFEAFKKALRKGKIKQVLMDQEKIAGIGNIYSDEILWHSKINPLKDALKLKEPELRKIFFNIKKVLKNAVRLRGESFSDYRDVEGKKGGFDIERKAYKREGEKCKRCKTIIKRIKIGGRSSCFCPKCQKL